LLPTAAPTAAPVAAPATVPHDASKAQAKAAPTIFFKSVIFNPPESLLETLKEKHAGKLTVPLQMAQHTGLNLALDRFGPP
jgi:hypothetical protein